MKSKPSLMIFLALIAILISACNLPTSNLSPADMTATLDAAVNATVMANMDLDDVNDDAVSDPADTEGTPPTNTPDPPTETPDVPTPTPSNTPIPCNLARFVSDVSVPDGTIYEPGEVFTKTWRLKNVGSCAWTSGYDIVFTGGDAMNAPGTVAVTAGTVNPGQNVDVSVIMTAPASEGTYRGNWKIQDPSNEVFGIENSNSGQFWVEIKVEEPEPTEHTKEISLSTRGMIFDGIKVRTNANNTGDSVDDVGVQGFLTFDVSGIPDNATVKSAKLIVAGYDVLGDPFGNLGCMRAYVHDYGSLGFEDFKPTGATGAFVRFCSEAKLNDTAEQQMNSIGVEGIQNALASNSFQIRLQFKDIHTNSDGIADMFRGGFKIRVVYETP